jgi:adenosylcobinamide-phosphate guanylyltransferase
MGEVTEKPMLRIFGIPMIEYVLRALEISQIERAYVAVSPHTPLTREYVQSRATIIDTPGSGYVEDLLYALGRIGTPGPILTVTSDLPLLSPDLVNGVLQYYSSRQGESMAVCVTWELCKTLGIRAEGRFEHRGQTVVPTGLNVVVKDVKEDHIYVIEERRLAVNVNRSEDIRICEELLGETL